VATSSESSGGGVLSSNVGAVDSLAVVGEVRYAGFWRRFVAAIVDGILVSILETIVAVVLTAILGSGTGASLAYAINLVLVFGYFAYMESSPRQATLGKMLLGIKVTDLEGNRVSFGRALGRNLAKIVSAIIFMIGYIMAAFTGKKQALHDMIASCLVVQGKGESA